MRWTLPLSVTPLFGKVALHRSPRADDRMSGTGRERKLKPETLPIKRRLDGGIPITEAIVCHWRFQTVSPPRVSALM
jgi:hypothetical protein